MWEDAMQRTMDFQVCLENPEAQIPLPTGPSKRLSLCSTATGLIRPDQAASLSLCAEAHGYWHTCMSIPETQNER
jgi:hypothetical protein